MSIYDLIEHRRAPLFSLEFFPPRTARGVEKLERDIVSLENFPIDYVSVTYGAGGTTRGRTSDLVVDIARVTKFTPVVHLTCVCHSRADIDALLDRYAADGLDAIMALRGDPPRDMAPGVDPYAHYRHAADLVAQIKQHAHNFVVGVAGFPEGHPDTPNRLHEIEYLKQKVDAGADYICTQLFYDNRDFYDFCERCRMAGIDVPIVAGLMPVTSAASVEKIAQMASGTRFPARLLARIGECEGDEQAACVGIEWTVAQCRDLMKHKVAGIHLYCLNNISLVHRFFDTLFS